MEKFKDFKLKIQISKLSKQIKKMILKMKYKKISKMKILKLMKINKSKNKLKMQIITY